MLDKLNSTGYSENTYEYWRRWVGVEIILWGSESGGCEPIKRTFSKMDPEPPTEEDRKK